MPSDFKKQYYFTFSKLIDFKNEDGDLIQGVQIFLYDPASPDRDNTTAGSLTKFWIGGANGLEQWPDISKFQFGDQVNAGFILIDGRPKITTVIDTESGTKEAK